MSTTITHIIINEENARRSKENMSFSDYKPGSATSEYQEICKEADERAARYPDNPKAQEAAARYKAEMGAWLNKRNARGAGHVSVMIAGPSGYNMRAHEKWVSAEDKGWKDYDAINQHFDNAMHEALKPVIHDADTDALEKLREKLSKEEDAHAAYVEHNKVSRKSANPEKVLPAYVLQNSNGRIKQLRDRIGRLEKSKAKEPRKLEFDGGYIKENTEAERTQIYFDSKPDADMRDKLKAGAWKWSPNSGAWQRQLTQNAWHSATDIVGA